jgi:hypothetical protein
MIRRDTACVEPYTQNIFAGMITLRDLAAWESRVAMLVAQADGQLDERDRTLERSGLYAEYPAILSGYLALLDDEESWLEALKRAVFIVWYSAVEAPMLTGIAELPESGVRATLEAIEAACREGRIDDELRWMLAWYNSVGDFALVRVPGMQAVEAAIESLDPETWRSVPLLKESMRDRGLLGRYWSSLVEGS